MGHKSVAVIALVASQLCWGVATAQTVQEASGIRTYEAAFFEAQNAQTALEMVLQVPGFVFENTDANSRGLSGATGNVLINQSRPNGKSDSLEDVLNRIPARNVERLELVQGGAAGYDTGRQSVVVNVVLRGQASTTRSLTATGIVYDDGHFSPSLEYVESRISGARSVTWSLETFTNHHAWRGTERLTAPDGEILNERRFEDPWTFEEISLSGNLEQAFGQNTVFSVQTRAKGFDFIRPGVFVEFTPDQSGELVEGVTDLNRTKRWGEAYEIAPELAFALGSNWRGEIIGLASSETFNDDSRFIDGATSDATTSKLKRTDREYLAQLAVFRSLPSGELRLGGEVAKNSRDQELTLLRTRDGETTPIDLPGSNALVAETRAEVFALVNHQLSQKWNVEAGLRYENSTLVREGRDANERSFDFIKPEFRARYQPDANRQILFNAYREVSQLSFGDFLSQIDFSQSGQLNGGNPTLSPSARWRTDATFEQRFGTGAVVSVTGFNEWIEDVIDRAPVFDGTFDAPANIGSATRFGGELNISSPLEKVGIPHARFDLAASFAESSVEDPVTGMDRTLSGETEWEVSVDYRQAFPNWKSNLEFSLSRASDRRIFRLSDIQIDPAITEAFLTLETNVIKNSVLSLTIDYIFEEEDDRTFEIFEQTRASGQLNSKLTRTKRQGAFYTLSFRHLF